MNVIPKTYTRPRGKVHVPTVTLAHGGGGKAMKDLIDDVFVEAFDNPLLTPLDDQARLDIAGLAPHGDRLAFTTDSFVVDPLIFRAATSETRGLWNRERSRCWRSDTVLSVVRRYHRRRCCDRFPASDCPVHGYHRT
jgi:hypothetical protein